MTTAHVDFCNNFEKIHRKSLENGKLSCGFAKLSKLCVLYGDMKRNVNKVGKVTQGRKMKDQREIL